jgi:hypothetical protein
VPCPVPRRSIDRRYRPTMSVLAEQQSASSGRPHPKCRPVTDDGLSSMASAGRNGVFLSWLRRYGHARGRVGTATGAIQCAS